MSGGMSATQHPQRSFPYVGPEAILDAVCETRRWKIECPEDLRKHFAQNAGQADKYGLVAATYVVSEDLVLYLADRRSEHVACARGLPVAAAGEIFIELHHASIAIARISNQSTGYCPSLDSWNAIAGVLLQLGVETPGGFDPACEFRRCDACKNIQIVKDGVFDCIFCATPLSADWNVGLPDNQNRLSSR